MEKLLISSLVFCLGIGFICVVETCNYPIPEQEPVPVQIVKQNVKHFESKQTGSKFKKIKYDYRSSEPTVQELDVFLKKHPSITTVIRLNGTGKDSNGLNLETEAKICDDHGVKFIYSPMSKNYKQWAESIMPVMLKENVLIHCHHGYDRTGFIFAYKLMKYHNYSFNEIREMNKWDKYDTYSKKFYPILKKLQYAKENPNW